MIASIPTSTTSIFRPSSSFWVHFPCRNNSTNLELAMHSPGINRYPGRGLPSFSLAGSITSKLDQILTGNTSRDKIRASHLQRTNLWSLRNHPSISDCRSSGCYREWEFHPVTGPILRSFLYSLRILQITLDYLIVGRAVVGRCGFFSFRQAGLL